MSEPDSPCVEPFIHIPRTLPLELLAHRSNVTRGVGLILLSLPFILSEEGWRGSIRQLHREYQEVSGVTLRRTLVDAALRDLERSKLVTVERSATGVVIRLHPTPPVDTQGVPRVDTRKVPSGSEVTGYPLGTQGGYPGGTQGGYPGGTHTDLADIDDRAAAQHARACEGSASDRDGAAVRLDGPALTDPPGDGGPRPPWGLGSPEARAICAEIGLGEYDLKQLCDECGVQEVNWQLCWWEARGRERPHSWCERGPKVAFRTYCRQHLPAPREVSEGQRVAELEARRAELRAQAQAERPPASPEYQARFAEALAAAAGDHVKAAASLVAHLTGQMTAPGASGARSGASGARAGAPLSEPEQAEFERRKRRVQEQAEFERRKRRVQEQAAAALRRGAARGE